MNAAEVSSAANLLGELHREGTQNSSQRESGLTTLEAYPLRHARKERTWQVQRLCVQRVVSGVSCGLSGSEKVGITLLKTIDRYKNRYRFVTARIDACTGGVFSFSNCAFVAQRRFSSGRLQTINLLALNAAQRD